MFSDSPSARADGRLKMFYVCLLEFGQSAGCLLPQPSLLLLLALATDVADDDDADDYAGSGKQRTTSKSSMCNSNCLTKYPSKAIRIKALTRTLASVKLVHIAISSRVDMSGYRFRLNVCSNSCNCCDVKCVRWRRCRLFFLSFFVSSLATICSSCITKLVFSTFTLGSFSDRLPEGKK